MRLRSSSAVVISVVLLMAIGIVGIVLNRLALDAADTVHRADTAALGENNAVLAGQLQLSSAAELLDTARRNRFVLDPGAAADRRVLTEFVTRSRFFGHGAALTDLSGTVLTATRATGLPSPTDAAIAPLRRELLAGRAGYSGVTRVEGVWLIAVAVPVVVDGAPAAVLIAFAELARTPLQGFVAKLDAPTEALSIVDATGRVVAADDAGRLGAVVHRSVVPALHRGPPARFVDYREGETDMIAVVVGGLPGGWAYVRTQTRDSFDGAVHSRNNTINLALMAMLVVGVLTISAFGYRAGLEQRRAEERFRALFQHAPDIVAILDDQGRLSYTSPSASTVLGFADGALVGRNIFEIVHPDDRARMLQQLAALLDERDGVLRLQCRVLDVAGRARWFELTASNQMHNPSLGGLVINARDVSENRAFQERLAHEAQHDALTGLPNRRRMQDALDASLARDPVALLFVDLDGFKPVNDVYGHQAGDELLRQVARRLSACVRQRDVLARVGGDEFVVLMPGVVNRSDAETMSARVREVLELPFTVAGHVVTIGASVGVHLAIPSDDPDQALRAADHAMYEVKRNGGGRRHRLNGRNGRGVEAVPAGRHRRES